MFFSVFGHHPEEPFGRLGVAMSVAWSPPTPRWRRLRQKPRPTPSADATQLDLFSLYYMKVGHFSRKQELQNE